MKVCVPSLGEGGLDDDVSQHFGRAPTYTVYDTDADTVDVYENDSDHRGGSGSPPQMVVETGADALVCSQLGQRAIEKFHAMEFPVYCGADGTVRDAIERFQDDGLERARPGSDNCGGGHEHGDGGHGPGHGPDHDHEHDPGHDHDGNDHGHEHTRGGDR